MEDGGHLENTHLQCIACTLKHIAIHLHQGFITIRS